MSELVRLSHQGLLHLDVEYGNASCFYSAVKCNDAPHLGGAFGDKEYLVWRGKLVNTDILITDDAFVSGDCLNRSLNFSIQSESRVFDFVSRFVVYSFNDRKGYIDDKAYPHVSKNIYRQFAVTSGVSVPVGETAYLKFSSLGAQVPEGFDEVFYIRDESKDLLGCRWIVHHRLIVNPKKVRLIVRSCNPRFEGVLPFEQCLPDILKRPLFRVREAHFPNFPIMAVGEAILKQGEDASLCTQVKYCG